MLTQTPQGRLSTWARKAASSTPSSAPSTSACGATVLALLLSLPLALYLNLYKGRDSRTAVWTRFFLDVLWGIPSIVYGAFGFVVMLALGLRASLLAGILTVALLEFPIMCRAIDEVMRLVPRELTEASASLGATRLETALKVVVRQAAPGILTARPASPSAAASATPPRSCSRPASPTASRLRSGGPGGHPAAGHLLPAGHARSPRSSSGPTPRPRS